MTLASNQNTGVARTERGLVVAGTRITLYQFMDYIHAGHPYAVIRRDFPQITDEQFDAAMSYIEANWADVEAEYQIVVKQDEEVRQYWEDRNRELFEKIAKFPRKPEHAALWAKLDEQKAKRALENS